MVPVSDQDMNTHLAEVSRQHTDKLNTQVALHQLYQYASKYYDVIIQSLDEDPAAQNKQLTLRLQQIAAALENKVTDLWPLASWRGYGAERTDTKTQDVVFHLRTQKRMSSRTLPNIWPCEGLKWEELWEILDKWSVKIFPEWWKLKRWYPLQSVWRTSTWHPKTNPKQGCKMVTVTWLQMGALVKSKRYFFS